MSSGIMGLQEEKSSNGNEGIQAQEGGLGEEERGKEGDDGDRSSAGNRWPQEETLALLKIRLEMDVEFRESGHKGPLWDEVSRRLLSEFGFRRSAKKCKEKFENIDKYYRRTKEGKSGRPNGKNYRFFEQLEALHQIPLQSISGYSSPPTPPANGTRIDDTTIAMAIDPINVCTNSGLLYAMHNSRGREINTTTAASTSTNSTSTEGQISRKRKYKELFEKLMREVTEKQENLHRSFVEAIERYDRDRTAREEAWRVQETTRMRREHEMLVHDRKIAAAKDAAVIEFLQKFSQRENPGVLQLIGNPSPNPNPNPTRIPQFPDGEKSEEKQEHHQTNGKKETKNNIGNFKASPMSSRWPKSEVEALINIRSGFSNQQVSQDNGTKGSLWEEISSAMKKLGYERSAKRCKEKWENINKYFKRVRDSSKKRSEDSRTCPYFHQLNALYSKEKNLERGENRTASGKVGEGDHNNPGEEDDELEEELDEEEDGDNYQIVVNNK